MSSSLYWRPLVKTDNYLGSDLKCALRERFDAECLGETEIGQSELDWLRGYIAAKGRGSEEAERLVKLIETHGSVMIWEES